jgi:Mitochondrial carrier protein
MTTTLAGLFSYPADTVRRRMMMQSGQSKTEKMYRNSFQCFASMYNDEGILSFYKGAFTNVIRGMCGALVLVLYDVFQDYSEHLIEHLSNPDPTELPPSTLSILSTPPTLSTPSI